ncbi:sugar transferase [Bacteroidales bacterium OttesenSCG-928-C19]|nr:sugar transferase [Bacteroidales bacterium OttesenSCG-928-C19]
MYKHFFKRFFDLILSLFGFLILSPFFIIIVIFLFFANNGKPFFIQKRPGKNSKIFNVIKFKTMNDKKDDKGNLLPPKERVTPIGAFVRKTSLDEIPQLLNVIIGDMSIVGPRPLREEYLPFYSKEQARRHEIRPGITGWAQVNGRNTISWVKRFEYDVWYVDHISFKQDCKIILLTIKNVLKREGIEVGLEKPFGDIQLKS